MWSRHQSLRVVVCTGVPPKHRGVFARVPRSTETDLLGVAERVGTLEPPRVSLMNSCGLRTAVPGRGACVSETQIHGLMGSRASRGVPAWILGSRQEPRGSKTLACNALGSEMRRRGPWGSGRDPQQRATTPGDGVQGPASGGAEGTGRGLGGSEEVEGRGGSFCADPNTALNPRNPGACSRRLRSPLLWVTHWKALGAGVGRPGGGWGARGGRPPILLLQMGCPPAPGPQGSRPFPWAAPRLCTQCVPDSTGGGTRAACL